LENFAPPDEAASPELRKRVVTEFVRDVSEGRISLSLDYRDRRPEDIQMVSDVLAKLVNSLNSYVLGLTAGEEFDFLERQLFFCVTVLRTYGAFKTTLNPTKVEEELQKLSTRIGESKASLDKILIQLSASKRPANVRRLERKSKPERKKSR
jgi:hypothetical protein